MFELTPSNDFGFRITLQWHEAPGTRHLFVHHIVYGASTHNSFLESPMIRILLTLALAATTVTWNPLVAQDTDDKSVDDKTVDDPYMWLEEVESEKALEWVENRNDATKAELESLPLFEEIRTELLEIYNSDARIPNVAIRGNYVYNFWQDGEHIRGIWRRTSFDDYLADEPNWEIVIDIDALAEDEDMDWYYKGVDCLRPEYRRCMVSLSRGGADAVTRREFDTVEMKWVENGFEVAESRGSTAWIDENNLVVSANFGEGTLTDSDYPRQSKVWLRGTPLEKATLLYEGEKADVGTFGWTDRSDDRIYQFVTRAVTFFESEYFTLSNGEPGREMVQLDLPLDSEVRGVFKNQLLVRLVTDWEIEGTTYPAGALLAVDYDEFLGGSTDFHVVVAPSERTNIEAIDNTKDYLIVNTIDNVRGQLHRYQFDGGEWTSLQLDAPAHGAINLGSASKVDDRFFFTYTGFLSPNTLFLADNGGSELREVKQLPDFFDAEGLTVSQHEAKSADGTLVPYFMVHREDIELNGANPTLLYGYGGFEISMTPFYSASAGTAWMERGGVYVVANIRGGGEFGPDWHLAALKENQQRSFDDFHAVAEDLISRRITSRDHLGIYGGSQGGLLVGVAFTQRPDLYGAVVCRVPLLDMKRYNKLLAGASWMAEYGNPDIPEEWEYISKYSPYHNVSPDVDYPRVFFDTSTRDDRVHPGHARKMVAKMTAQGHEVLYYENTKGGHAAATDNEQRAYIGGLIYSYLWQEIGLEGNP